MQFSSLTYKNRLRSKIQLNQSALCYPKLSKWIFRKDSIHHTTCSYLLLFNKGKKLYQNYLKPWNFAWALLKTQYLCNRNFLNVCLDDEKWHNSKRLWFMDRCNFSNVASSRLIYTQNSSVATIFCSADAVLASHFSPKYFSSRRRRLWLILFLQLVFLHFWDHYVI